MLRLYIDTPLIAAHAHWECALGIRFHPVCGAHQHDAGLGHDPGIDVGMCWGPRSTHVASHVSGR
jgi:hypothetical protein